jgi:hypothetical protein
MGIDSLLERKRGIKGKKAIKGKRGIRGKISTREIKGKRVVKKGVFKAKNRFPSTKYPGS